MIRNLRDFSVYKNKNKKRLKKGLFYRSAALYGLNKRDKKFLDKRCPMTVIDLRMESERLEKPDYIPDKYVSISLLEDMVSGISHDRESHLEVMNKIPAMTKLYAGFIENEYSVHAIREVFEKICDPDRTGPILWHCSEGKDRCGLISALFLKMMDFDDKVIMKDYMKSMKSSRKQAWKYFFLALILKRNPVMAKRLKDVFTVKEEYLYAAFKEILKQYGDFDLFFLRIGVTDEVKKRMQKKYLR